MVMMRNLPPVSQRNRSVMIVFALNSEVKTASGRSFLMIDQYRMLNKWSFLWSVLKMYCGANVN